jgi:Acetyltransferases
MDIVKGNINSLAECAECLSNCKLGENYFSDFEHTSNFLKEMFEKEEIYICYDENKVCLGFAGIDLNGAFSIFPILRLLAVKTEYRNKGIGKLLLNFYEKLGFEKSSKVFLLVGEYNPDAKRFYERSSYFEVGKIPDLYREGVSEFLMMKKRMS